MEINSSFRSACSSFNVTELNQVLDRMSENALAQRLLRIHRSGFHEYIAPTVEEFKYDIEEDHWNCWIDRLTNWFQAVMNLEETLHEDASNSSNTTELRYRFKNFQASRSYDLYEAILQVGADIIEGLQEKASWLVPGSSFREVIDSRVTKHMSKFIRDLKQGRLAHRSLGYLDQYFTPSVVT